MNSFARLALTALVAVVVAGGALYLIGPGREGAVGGSAPTPTIFPPTTAPSPTPSALASIDPLDTARWTTYTSNRYGFSIGHPADWMERPSAHVWSFPADADWLSPATEGFIAPADAILATAWSAPIAPGTTVETWLKTYCPKSTGPCTGLQNLSSNVNLDGHPGQLIRFADDTQAFIPVGGRMYVAAIWEPDFDSRTTPYGGARRLLETYVSTMHLLAGGAAPSASPRPS
jgi:hypothetical protein